jgi:hypothetical protein
VPFDFEVIVVDDGSLGVETSAACGRYCGRVRYDRIERPPGFQNQARPRNMAYRMAEGEIVISQGDDVVHATSDCIERLVTKLEPGRFIIANVINTDEAGHPVVSYGVTEYTGLVRKAPLFFLGSLYRRDIYRVGGNDEDFMIAPAYEDNWFGDCLIHGLGLVPDYRTDIVGHHLDHPRTTNPTNTHPSDLLYRAKKQAALTGEGTWCAAAGPWPYKD